MNTAYTMKLPKLYNESEIRGSQPPRPITLSTKIRVSKRTTPLYTIQLIHQCKKPRHSHINTAPVIPPPPPPTAYINAAPKTVESSTTTPHTSGAISSGSGARPTAALAASWLGGAAHGLLLRSRRARNAPPLVELAAIRPRDISNRAPDPGDTEVHGRGVEDAAGGGVVDELGRHAGRLGGLADASLALMPKPVGRNDCHCRASRRVDANSSTMYAEMPVRYCDCSTSEPLVPPTGCMGPVCGRPPMAKVRTLASCTIVSVKSEQVEAQMPSESWVGTAQRICGELRDWKKFMMMMMPSLLNGALVKLEPSL